MDKAHRDNGLRTSISWPLKVQHHVCTARAHNAFRLVSILETAETAGALVTLQGLIVAGCTCYCILQHYVVILKRAVVQCAYIPALDVVRTKTF